MRTTPRKEIKPAICSLRVNGSWRRNEQAQQATIGARKVITVASESGRYWSESGAYKVVDLKRRWKWSTHSTCHILYAVSYCRALPRTLLPPTPKKSTNSTCNQESAYFWGPKGCFVDFSPPLIDAAEDQSAYHSSENDLMDIVRIAPSTFGGGIRGTPGRT